MSQPISCLTCFRRVCDEELSDDANLRAVILCPECYAAEQKVVLEAVIWVSPAKNAKIN